MERRTFLKFTAAAAAVASVTGCESSSASDPLTPPSEPVLPPIGEGITWGSCATNCWQACPLKVHSKDGVITRIETEGKATDDWDNFDHEIRPCPRGRSMRQKVYNHDRLKYPMKRVGRRGSDEFVRISWEEAVSSVAAAMEQTYSQYGKNAIFMPLGGGSHDLNTGVTQSSVRLLNMAGGCLFFHNDYSASQYREGSAGMYGYLASNDGDTVGFWNTGSSLRSLEDSDLMLCFGYNPMEARLGGAGSGYEYLNVKKKNNFKTYYIDPRFTDTAVTATDEWVPIRPGTDAALCEAIAYVLIEDGYADIPFLKQYTYGYDKYEEYITGVTDDIAKTPERAETICGIPAEKIREIAEAIGTASAPFVTQGFGPQRQGNGENNARAVMMLPLLVGKISGPGTNHGGTPGNDGLSHYAMMPADSLKDLMNMKIMDVTIPAASHLDAIEFGTQMKPSTHDVRYSDPDLMAADTPLETNVRFLWLASSNMLANQNGDINRADRLLNDESLVDFVVVVEQHMTSSAKYADIILPEVSWLEMYDVIQSYNKMDCGSLMYAYGITPAVDPMFECKPAYDICHMIANQLGIGSKFTNGGMTYLDQVRKVFSEFKKSNPWIQGDTFEEFVSYGPQRRAAGEHPNLSKIKDFITNPVENPLGTPSGKIEIYSQYFESKQSLAEGTDEINPLPVYFACDESYEDEQSSDYPFQCINYHGKHSAHSIHASTPWLNEVLEHHLWLNPVDAGAVGVISGQKVIVESRRGKLEITVRVTPRIVPGVVAMPQGQWRRMKGDIDVGGCANTLTDSKPSPLAKSFRSNTNRVRVYSA